MAAQAHTHTRTAYKHISSTPHSIHVGRVRRRQRHNINGYETSWDGLRVFVCVVANVTTSPWSHFTNNDTMHVWYVPKCRFGSLASGFRCVHYIDLGTRPRPVASTNRTALCVCVCVQSERKSTVGYCGYTQHQSTRTHSTCFGFS